MSSNRWLHEDDLVSYAQIEAETGIPAAKLRIWSHRNTSGLKDLRLGDLDLPLWDRDEVIPVVVALAERLGAKARG